MLRKQFAAKAASIDEKLRTVTFTASTQEADRYGDTLTCSGWKLDNYLRNPVVLWSHRNGDPPIGKCVAIRTETNPPALVQTIKFAEPEIYPFADTLFKLTKGGYLNAVSVGFLPLSEPKPRIDEKTGEFLGYEYSNQELLETSLVCVPANASALARAFKQRVVSEEEIRTVVKDAFVGLESLFKEEPKTNPARELLDLLGLPF